MVSPSTRSTVRRARVVPGPPARVIHTHRGPRARAGRGRRDAGLMLVRVRARALSTRAARACTQSARREAIAHDWP